MLHFITLLIITYLGRNDTNHERSDFFLRKNTWLAFQIINFHKYNWSQNKNGHMHVHTSPTAFADCLFRWNLGLRPKYLHTWFILLSSRSECWEIFRHHCVCTWLRECMFLWSCRMRVYVCTHVCSPVILQAHSQPHTRPVTRGLNRIMEQGRQSALQVSPFSLCLYVCAASHYLCFSES